MPIIHLFSRRPLIGLTLLYILLLVVLDRAGFFSHHPRLPDAGGPHCIEGTVSNEPRQKNSRTVFIVHASSLDGRAWNEQLLVTSYGETAVDQGDVVRISGTLKAPAGLRNEGGFDYRTYLQRQGVHALLYTREIELIGRRRISPITSSARRVRNDIINVIKVYLPEREASVLIPMLVGDKSGLTTEISRSFSDAGVMHVLVVSGMNVAYCIAIFLFFFRLLGLSHRKAALCTIPFIILYVFVTGAAAPVVRAGIMALFVILSLGLAREPLIYQALGCAALVILILDPPALFTASFQLSFAATIGIVALYPFLMAHLVRLPPWLRRTLGATVAVSFAAQAAVIPLIAHYFNRISLIGLVSNILVVPLTALITIAGISLYIFHFFSAPLAHVAAFCTYWLIHILLYLIGSFSSVSWATVAVASPSPALMATYYLLLFGIPAVRRHPKTGAVIAAATLLLIVANVGNYLYHRNELRVTFLDVGNGDAIHIAFPGGTHWLIDGGGAYRSGFDPGEHIICPYFRSKGIRRIDRIVITHPHLPHFGGLGAVIEGFPVGEIVTGPARAPTPAFAGLLDIIRKKSIPLRTARAGDRFFVAGSTVGVLSPGTLFEDDDDNCLVISVEGYGKRFLLTSDMGMAAEKAILSSGLPLATTVLQLPNHGQRHLTADFLRQSKPEVMVVSVGQKEVTIDGYDTGILSTKERGAITFAVSARGIARTCARETEK